MKRFLSLFLCFVSTFFCFACNEKVNIEDTNVVNQLKQKIELIVNDYYDRYENKTFVADDVKEKLYVKVATDLKSAYNVSFGSVSFDKKEKIKFNLSKNSYIYTYAHYFKKGTLFVFAPLLALEGGFNKVLLFCVDGQYFSVKVYDGEYNNLTLKEAVSLGNNSNDSITKEKNNADRDVVTHSVSDLKTSLGILLNVDNKIVPLNSILLLRKSYQKYSDPTEYLIYVCNNDSYSFKIEHNESKEELQKGETRNVDVAVTLFGGGELGFDLRIKFQ